MQLPKQVSDESHIGLKESMDQDEQQHQPHQNQGGT